MVAGTACALPALGPIGHFDKLVAIKFWRPRRATDVVTHSGEITMIGQCGATKFHEFVYTTNFWNIQPKSVYAKDSKNSYFLTYSVVIQASLKDRIPVVLHWLYDPDTAQCDSKILLTPEKMSYYKAKHLTMNGG